MSDLDIQIELLKLAMQGMGYSLLFVILMLCMTALTWLAVEYLVTTLARVWTLYRARRTA